MDRVSSQNVLHENHAKIAQRLPYVLRVKNAQNFDIISYFAQILRKMLAFVYFIKFRETIPENDE